MDFNRVWLPFLYLYGVGGLIFLIGMYIISQSRSLKRERQRHKKWFYVLIFGFIYYVGIHSFFTLAAIDNLTIAYTVMLVIIILFTRLTFYLFKNSKALNIVYRHLYFGKYSLKSTFCYHKNHLFFSKCPNRHRTDSQSPP